LECFLTYLKAGDAERESVDPFTADKYATSVKAAFNWGTKHPSPTPILPNGFRPFATIEKYRRPIEAMMENTLLTITEIDALFRHADADLGLIRDNGRVRRRRPHEYRTSDANPYRGFEDVLRAYHATGARTSELASAVVCDYSRTSRQIVLRKHKRANTQKNGAARRITVNDQLAVILDRWCQGKKPDDPVFTDPKGRPWTRYTLNTRFQRVRDLAGVRREAIIYSFRHLWISDALMNGLDVATVSRMAGTSIAMIEKVYGHFRSDHLREAQALLDAGRERRRVEASAKTSAA
jgi:integrase